MSKEGGWKRFHKLSFDRKQLSKQALRAEALTKRHAHKFVLQRLRALRDARQYIATWILIVTVLIAAVAVQMTWHQSKYITQAAINGGTYAEATEGPIDTLNPLYATTSAELSANRLLFSQLFDYDNTGHLRSDAAKSITLDEMQKIYTVTLRNDILWHDGTKMTADDVVFTVQSMKNPEVRSVMRNNWKDVTVKKADELTVQFVLPAPYATFPHALTFSILPQHLLSSIQPGALRESAYSVAPVGSGPFKMRLLQTVPNTKDSQKIVHMTAWDKYYRGAPKLSRFELHAYDQQESLAHALSSGDVNAAAGLLFSDDVPQRFITDTTR
jgi:peptide/nickel transport system substrate-binding protein